MAKMKATELNNTKFSSQSSDRLLVILEYLASQSFPVRLQDISMELNIPQPTVLRYLNTLINQNYTYKDPYTLRYSLTWRVCRLSHQVMSHSGLREIVSPFLRELAQTFNGGACLVTQQDDGLLYLDVVDYPLHTLSTLQRIGKSAPMHTTGSGKILLAGLSDNQVERIIERTGLAPMTANTITELPVLLTQLQEIRKVGYAMDDEECEEGIRCVSAPLYDYTDTLIAAISVFGTVDNISDQCVEQELVPTIKSIAQRISSHLGH